MVVSIIAAVAKNNVIGKDNQLVWHLPADLKHFKQLTTGHHIIMGRKTYESIGRALPNRTSVIITRDKTYKAENCLVVFSLEEAIKKAKNDEEAFIIGGAEIYTQAIDLADRMYITHVDKEFEGDTWFPEIEAKKWKVEQKQEHAPDEKNEYSFSFVTYGRK